ncbi:MAG: hypothetical protein LBT92_02915 [Rickettsiales bacterium]|jgi:hypothetical protein|nr:hypothetical protein [Rickettsiales bacterium]
MKTAAVCLLALLAAVPAFGQASRDEWESRHSLMPLDLVKPEDATVREPSADAAPDSTGPLIVDPTKKTEPIVMEPKLPAKADAKREPKADIPAASAQKAVPEEPRAAPPGPEQKPEPFRLKGLDEMPQDDLAGGEFDAAKEASELIAPAEQRIVLRRLDRSRNYFRDEEAKPAALPGRSASPSSAPSMQLAPSPLVPSAPSPPASAPVSLMEPVAPRPPASTPPVKPVAAAAAAPSKKSGPRLHMASYRSREAAEAGIPKLKSEYPSIAGFSPSVSYEYADGLGYFWRVYFSGPLPELKKACAALKKSGGWCSIAAWTDSGKD